MSADFSGSAVQGTADIYMHGVGGRTVPKLRKCDLGVIAKLSPDIVILEQTTNDIAINPPEIVGSDIEELVRSIISDYSIRAVVLCQVTPRDQNSDFNERATILNQYTRVVMEPIERAIFWTHRGFANPSDSNPLFTRRGALQP